MPIWRGERINGGESTHTVLTAAEGRRTEATQMEKVFCLGLALGFLGGALIVANNYKARSLIKKGQQEVMDKVDRMMDEKLRSMENSAPAGGQG